MCPPATPQLATSYWSLLTGNATWSKSAMSGGEGGALLELTDPQMAGHLSRFNADIRSISLDTALMRRDGSTPMICEEAISTDRDLHWIAIQSGCVCEIAGDPYENRTRVFAVRGRRPNR